MGEQELEQRKQDIIADSRRMQSACGKLVERGVIHCASSMMYNVGQNLEDACKIFDLDYDEAIGWFQRDDYEEPVEEFIRNDADLDQLEEIADKVGYWSDVLESIGYDTTEPPQKPCNIDMVCQDCFDVMEIPEQHPDMADKRYAELCALTGEFQAQGEYGIHYCGEEHDDEFSIARCACCGSTLGGARFGYASDTEDIDLEDWLTPDKDSELREAIIKLITSDDEYREIGQEYDIEPYQHECFEHWIVDSWFAARLREHGQIVFDFCDFTIWGRCTTGQAILLDYVVQQIAKEQLAYSYIWEV